MHSINREHESVVTTAPLYTEPYPIFFVPCPLSPLTFSLFLTAAVLPISCHLSRCHLSFCRLFSHHFFTFFSLISALFILCLVYCVSLFPPFIHLFLSFLSSSPAFSPPPDMSPCLSIIYFFPPLSLSISLLFTYLSCSSSSLPLCLLLCQQRRIRFIYIQPVTSATEIY